MVFMYGHRCAPPNLRIIIPCDGLMWYIAHTMGNVCETLQIELIVELAMCFAIFS